jgi:SAM-dependent methyltransferase
MASPPSFKDILSNLVGPWLFMSLSLRRVPQTISQLLAQGRLRELLSPSAFADALFGNFWAAIGPNVKTNAEVRVVPLLEGRVSGGQVRSDVVGAPVRGVVLEVGAGSGMWADVLARFVVRDDEDAAGAGARRRAAGHPAGITKVYGVEPHPQSSAALRQRVRDLGIEDVYEVVPVGIESLGDPGAWPGTALEPGSVDCIVSVLCLCSIPEPAENIRRLHRLLKPGGTWYAYEHVQIPADSPLLRLYQRFINIFWSFFLGSCRLCRDTQASLRDAGAWQQIDVQRPTDESPYQMVPHVLGTLTK